MNAIFFQHIAALDLTGDLQIIIAKGSEGGYVVSVLLENEACTDEAKKLIPPLVLRGTAEELDTGFFTGISQPLQTVSGLMINMAAFTKQLEEAKKQSAIEKAKTDKEKKATDEKERKFKDAMAKAEGLEKEGKYKEAWMKLPEPSDFPEQAEAIRKRKTELSAKFSPSLFDKAGETVVATPPPAENTLFNAAPDSDEDHEEEEDNEDYNNDEE